MTADGLTVLVLDVGTTGLRASIVDEGLDIAVLEYRSCPPASPFEGLVEFDPAALASTALEACHAALDRVAPRRVDAVGVTTQRASTVLWDRATGAPVAPGLGWQDLRTITECITAQAERGWTIAPNQSITKLAWLLANTPGLDGRDLCFGTVDSWLVSCLSGGALHVSDGTNMSTTTTGMRVADGSTWHGERLDHFDISERLLPTVVDSAGVVGTASALPGEPPIAALIGDQQASLIGQACVRPGRAKLTLGTGGMLDLRTDAEPPTEIERSPAGTYALPMWQLDGALTWGAEGIMLSAGSNVEWLRDDLGLIDTSAASHDAASRCDDSGGVVYVPALLGLGTPQWDYGARGTLLGVTRGTEGPHVVRAVLEGIAHRGADLLEAAVADTGVDVEVLHVDGGMSQNPTVVQALADATGVPVEVSPVVEATTIGAAFLAGLGIGRWSSIEDIATVWRSARTVEPRPAVDRDALRARWHRAVERSRAWYPELSALEF